MEIKRFDHEASSIKEQAVWITAVTDTAETGCFTMEIKHILCYTGDRW